jgi:restriction endonuclease S subunit
LKTRLGHIANIQTGIFAKPVSKGEIVYLQSKHFNENGQLHSLLHPDLKADNITEKHLLRHGDVLFAAKGTKNFAAWYESKNQPSVASTSFFVIRLQENFSSKILPEFLVWLINHPVAQKFLKGKAIGTSIVSISKSVLEELEISIPDIKTQKAILKISQLHNTEKKIKQQIETLREKQIQQQIINSIKSEK